jgi:hypothetical protein
MGKWGLIFSALRKAGLSSRRALAAQWVSVVLKYLFPLFLDKKWSKN